MTVTAAASWSTFSKETQDNVLQWRSLNLLSIWQTKRAEQRPVYPPTVQVMKGFNLVIFSFTVLELPGDVQTLTLPFKKCHREHHVATVHYSHSTKTLNWHFSGWQKKGSRWFSFPCSTENWLCKGISIVPPTDFHGTQPRWPGSQLPDCPHCASLAEFLCALFFTRDKVNTKSEGCV